MVEGWSVPRNGEFYSWFSPTISIDKSAYYSTHTLPVPGPQPEQLQNASLSISNPRTLSAPFPKHGPSSPCAIERVAFEWPELLPILNYILAVMGNNLTSYYGQVH